MPYIGKSPVGGGFHKLDNLTASATATYALTLGSAAYYPETANHLLVSLNGVIQAPQDSYTVSGSNIIFSTALTASDSIDFIVALGDVLDVGSVTDGAITTAKLGNGAVTSAKLDTNIAVTGDLTVDTNTLYVDSADSRVGIGTTSPNSKLHISGNANNSSALSDTVTDFALKFDSATTTNYFSNAICFAEGTSVNASIASFDGGSGGAQGLVFGTGASNAERMRIDSSGNLLVGKSSTSLATVGAAIRGDAANGLIQATRSNGECIELNRTSSDGAIAFFTRQAVQVGNISVTGSSTAYNTSSDYRLKENVVADWDATTRLKQLNPVRFNFISDADTTVDGFLAHEVQDVVPEAISGTHNEVDDEGNPVYQGIDQSKLVPLLVKTIQELEARIAALENV